MLSIKEDVKLNGLQPPMIVALMIADSVFKARGIDTVITSATDGDHKRGSLHYVGLALDLRIRHLEEGEAEIISNEIRRLLKKEFDVILSENNIHIEFQPK